MTASDIREAIASFLAAARRSVEAGGDIVYVHAGGGDLLNQFLSPYFNCRGDEWGGSPANRFRIVSEIVQGIKAAHPGVPVLVKMNAMDFTPGPGVTPELAVEYAAMLAGIGVDALELTSGVKFYNFMRCWRGGVPVREILDALPGWKRPVAYLKFKLWALQYGLVEGWNLDYLRAVRPVTGPMALLLVGGVRTSAFMEQVLARGEADFVCLSRPFIREPNLVKKIREGAPAVSCTSCNLCFARAAAEQPVRCSNAGAG
jgi:2,4-dienoyl-CoA reductase-like NADH-dependent reductase (Old Yellow Enzyme family)